MRVGRQQIHIYIHKGLSITLSKLSLLVFCVWKTKMSVDVKLAEEIYGFSLKKKSSFTVELFLKFEPL